MRALTCAVARSNLSALTHVLPTIIRVRVRVRVRVCLLYRPRMTSTWHDAVVQACGLHAWLSQSRLSLPRHTPSARHVASASPPSPCRSPPSPSLLMLAGSSTPTPVTEGRSDRRLTALARDCGVRVSPVVRTWETGRVIKARDMYWRVRCRCCRCDAGCLLTRKCSAPCVPCPQLRAATVVSVTPSHVGLQFRDAAAAPAAAPPAAASPPSKPPSLIALANKSASRLTPGRTSSGKRRRSVALDTHINWSSPGQGCKQGSGGATASGGASANGLPHRTSGEHVEWVPLACAQRLIPCWVD